MPALRPYLLRLAILAAALFLYRSDVYGQDLRASLTGIVTDSSGAAVPEANVSVTNIETQVTFATKTNGSGSYVILFLIPGRYTVNVEATGFKQFKRENVVLSTSERGTLDVNMDVGQTSETVNITSEVPLLETTTASRINAVSSQQMMDLPSNSRNIYNTILALPGVTKQDRNQGAFSNYGLVNSTRIAINGGIARENETVMDGVVNTQPDKTVTFQPPLEAVSEVSVQTSNFDASYGRFGGGVTAINTKAGSNSLHGSVYEYHTNSALAANPWAYNLAGIQRPAGRQNQYGFEVDAPVFIPKLFNGKNKLFFMLAYEAHRVKDAGVGDILPSDAQRTGDFSGIPRLIYDPLTSFTANGRLERTPFANNQIPQSRINPVARNLVGFLPSPNIANQQYGVRNYLSPVGGTSEYNLWTGRLDYRINDNNNLSFIAGKLPYAEVDGVLYPNSPADPSTENPLARNFDRYVVDWTSTLSPTLLLNFRAGYVRYGEQSGNPLAVGFDNRTLGIDPALVAQQRVAMFPRYQVGGFYADIGSSNPLNKAVRDTESFQLNVTKSLARHQLKMGTEYRLYRTNQWTSGAAGGSYAFTNAWTQLSPTVPTATGDEFASLLLGYPQTGQIDLTIDPSFQNRYYTVFVQDDMRLFKNLSVNLGLRWDYETPSRERYNRMIAGFAFDQPSPLASKVPGTMGGLVYAGSEGDSRYSFNPDHNNIQPRIGVAWQVAQDWVLRGGYGLYYMGTFNTAPTTGFSASTPLVASTDANVTPAINLVNAFPNGLTQPVGSSLGLATNLGQVADFGYRDRGTPWAQQFAFGVQHVLPFGMVAEATYSGNLARAYPVDIELNSIPKDELGKPASYYQERVANPFQGLLPANSNLNGATIPRQNLLVPFPQFTSVMMRNVPIGRNDYHALQTRLAMRYRNGMTLNLGYVWSKTLEQRSFLNNQDFNLQDINASKLEKRLAEFDVPHRFTALVTYELPFGRNKLIGSNVSGFVDRLINGWQVNATLTLQSGFPAAFPNAPIIGDQSAKLPSDQIDMYHAFNTSLFPRVAPNPTYTYRTWPTRFPDVRTRPQRNLDASISKKTTLTERLRLEIRAEAYNATNTPWFNNLNSGGNDVTRAEFGWFNLSSASNRTITLIGKLIW